jgi:hypothetical protein
MEEGDGLGPPSPTALETAGDERAALGRVFVMLQQRMRADDEPVKCLVTDRSLAEVRW